MKKVEESDFSDFAQEKRLKQNYFLVASTRSLCSITFAAHPDVLPITNKGVKIGVGIPKKLYAEAI